MALSGFQEIMTSRQFSHEVGWGPHTFEDLTSSAHTAGTRPNAGTAKALLSWTVAWYWLQLVPRMSMDQSLPRHSQCPSGQDGTQQQCGNSLTNAASQPGGSPRNQSQQKWAYGHSLQVRH